MNLYLIGYRGTGKTTVGRLVAAARGWPCVDADEEIERRAGKTIAEIFQEQGEPAFRELEAAVVADFTTRTDHVVSLGGGAILRAESRKQLKASGKTVWLTAAPQTILARLEQDAWTRQRRPALTVHATPLAEIEHLLAAREPLYRECADQIIDTEGKSPEEIAALVRA
jgi:shikimate kinase